MWPANLVGQQEHEIESSYYNRPFEIICECAIQKIEWHWSIEKNSGEAEDVNSLSERTLSLTRHRVRRFIETSSMTWSTYTDQDDDDGNDDEKCCFWWKR